MRDEFILSVKDLSVAYQGCSAVHNVSFDLKAGEIIAIVGESGSGKSSIALALMRLLDEAKLSGLALLRLPDGGTLELIAAREKEIRQVRGRDVAMIFQEPVASLNPINTIRTQIREAIQLHGTASKAEINRRSLELLSRVGIQDAERCLDSYPHQLSGGQCQRIGIAMALANSPALLIADEPTTALDVTVQAQILSALSKLQKESNLAILFVTHDLELVRQFADRVIVMYAGEVVESGSTAQLFKKPLMPYTRGLLASRPRMHANGRDRYPLEPIPGSFAGIFDLPEGCRFHPRCAHCLHGLCDKDLQVLEQGGDDHLVRCVRWKILQ
jgi:peptide/nickel transport system ATP-binding protein